jgi:asparagine synthase (glutamine-hydrolysing)
VDLVPAAIADRPKQPYRAPDSQSFSGDDAPGYVTECLGTAAIADAGLFDPRAVEKLARKCRAQPFVGFRDNMAFVGILSTQLWHRAFVEGFAARPASLDRRAAIA